MAVIAWAAFAGGLVVAAWAYFTGPERIPLLLAPLGVIGMVMIGAYFMLSFMLVVVAVEAGVRYCLQRRARRREARER